jgi:protease-4
VVAGAALGGWLRWRRPYNVLRLEIGGDLPDVESELSRLGFGGRRRPEDLVTLLAVLRTAREDPDLGLVLLDVHDLGAGWSRIQSCRRAMLALRAAGKRVWAYLARPGMHEYYLASAADRVLVAPAARFDVTGLASEVIFLKGALDRLGIEAQLARAGRFKSAAEPLTRADMSAEHRTMLNDLLDDLYGQVVADIAATRRLSADAVRAALAEGPLAATDALERGLVDAVAYPDEVVEQLEERFGDPAPIDLARYQRRRRLAMRREALRATPVGLLAVSGPIALGDGLAGAAGGRSSAWRTFRRELDALARDPRIKGIVLRIDSPGGSGLASDLMWREIVQARAWKPVVVSMGDVAASGGYYLAAAADHVTAEPGTLTGSIGVLAGKPVLRGLYDRLGITKELVVRGNAGRASDYIRLDETELARLRAEADAFYGDFVAKVARGRRLAPEAVEAAAEGRVWTGRQAADRGLVDVLGGLEQSLEEVGRRLGLPPGARFALDRRPRRRAFWRSAPAWPLPAALAAPLDALAPLLQGERVLAAMPFLVRFVRPAALGAFAAAAPASRLAWLARAARGAWAAARRPRPVL